MQFLPVVKSDYPSGQGVVCMDCGDRISLIGPFLRWKKMYFCNKTCITVHFMDKARECTECKTKIQLDLLGNRSRRTGNGNVISYFCSVDCTTAYNRNLTNEFYDDDGGSTLDAESFQDIWNNIFKNGEYNRQFLPIYIVSVSIGIFI